MSLVVRTRHTEVRVIPLNELRADTHRQYGRFSDGCLLKGAFTRRTFRVVVILRLCQGIAVSHRVLRLTLPFFQILHRIATHSAGMDLSWKTKIGGGLALNSRLGFGCQS